MLWLLAALLGVSLCCILLLGTAALLVDTNREYPTDSPFYRMLLYTSIAINGLLFHYKPTNAVVTVDGEMHTYHHVWLAPTMNGRYYGGGMMPTPAQRRLNPDGTISTMVMQAENPDSVSLHFQRSAYPPQRDGGSADRSSHPRGI